MKTLFVAYLLTSIMSTMAYAKWTICTATINSKDEKETFKKYLKGDEYEWVELVPETEPDNVKNSDQWMQKACKKGQQCDVLIVSGHFAGGFFGSSGHGMSLTTMESHSCREDCYGLLKAPLEVFLFGCNTLASKDIDHRSPDQYLQVLLDDGLDRSVAERIVEGRYGFDGPSTKDRIRRVFEGVPNLYGFSSVGPLGNIARKYVANYLSSKGNYSKHLEKLEAQRDAHSTQSVINLELKNAFTPTGCFTQSAGMYEFSSERIQKQRQCLFYGNTDIKTKLQVIKDILEQEDFNSYLGQMADFFRYTDLAQFKPQSPEALFLEDIKNEEKARQIIIGLLLKSRTASFKNDLAHMALTIGWLQVEEKKQLEKSIVADLLKLPLTTTRIDTFCALYPKLIEQTDLGALPASTFKGINGLRALSCFKQANHQTLKVALQELNLGSLPIKRAAAQALAERKSLPLSMYFDLLSYLNINDKELRSHLANIYTANEVPNDENIFNYLEAALLKFPFDNPGLGNDLAHALSKFNRPLKNTIPFIANCFNSKKSNKEKTRCATIAERLKIKIPQITMAIADFLKNYKSENKQEDSEADDENKAQVITSLTQLKVFDENTLKILIVNSINSGPFTRLAALNGLIAANNSTSLLKNEIRSAISHLTQDPENIIAKKARDFLK